MALTAVQLSPPRDWQAFERSCRVLFACILVDPNVQTHGRSGQRQHGVDIFGYRNGALVAPVGVQCKGKDAHFGEQITDEELRVEVQETSEFKPALREFILVTTAQDDAHIQGCVRRLNEELNGQGRELRVSVMGWGSLEQEILRFSDAIEAFQPDLTPYSKSIVARLDKGLSLQSSAAEMLGTIQTQLTRISDFQVNASTAGSRGGDAFDQYLHTEIDQYRDEIRSGKAETALRSLETMRKRCFKDASPRVKFRIITNTAAATLRLGRKDVASALFLEAFPYDPEDHIAQSNQALAYLLNGDVDTARQLAISELKRAPTNSAVAVVRLQTITSSEDVDAIFEAFSDDVKADSNVRGAVVQVLRSIEDRRWRNRAVAFARSDQANLDAQRFAAEATLDRALSDSGAQMGEKRSGSPSADDIRAATDVLSAQWQVAKAHEGPLDCALACNTALGYAALDEPHNAIAVLEEAKETHGFDEPVVRLLALLKAEAGASDDAVQLLRTLPESPRRDGLLADLLSRTDPAAALELVSRVRPLVTLDAERITLSLIEVRAAITARDHEVAHGAATRLVTDFPKHPAGYVCLYRVADAFGREGSKGHLRSALERLQEGTEFVGRIHLAQALQSAEMYQEVVDTLRDRVDTGRDSDALRLLCVGLLNADRRASVEVILRSVPTHVSQLPFFLRCELTLAQRAGDFQRAKSACERLLRENPNDIGVRNARAMLSLREGDLATAKENLSFAATLSGDPSQSMQVALLLDHIGESSKGHELAYRVLLSSPDNAEVALGYIGAFLRPGHSEALPLEIDAVAPDTAVVLEGPAGENRRFVLEGNPTLRTSEDHIDMSGELAGKIMGLRKGASVLLGGDEPWSVKEIKHKYLDALHRLLETFHVRFPTAGGLQRFLIRDGDKAGLAPMLASVRERHDQIKEVFDAYERDVLPLTSVAASLGKPVVETFIGLVQDGRAIRSCLGNEAERVAAFAAIEKNGRKGCILDPVAFHIIRRLGLERVVQSVCGPIGVTASTVVDLERRIAEVEARLAKEDFSIAWQNGEFVRATYSIEEKRRCFETLTADQSWVTNNNAFVPAIETTDLPHEVMRMDRLLGGRFADDMRAAESTGRLLLSEDFAYRALSAQSLGLPCTWLQPVLMVGRKERLLSDTDYHQAVFGLIEAGLTYVSIDMSILAFAFNEDVRSNSGARFLTVAKRLGGPNADSESHLAVATEFLRALWRSTASRLRKSSATGALLDCLRRPGSLSSSRAVDIVAANVGLHGPALEEFKAVVSVWQHGSRFRDR